jgi:small subunit ribosomal protein S19e
MVSALEAPADELIKKLAEKLKSESAIKAPTWMGYAKTGPHAERKPQEKDFWYTRAASILRKLYLEKNVGVGKLRTWYGRSKSYGNAPEHHVDAGGSIIRKALQQLESAGYVKKEKIGRTLTPKGRSFIDKTVMEFYKGEKRERARRFEEEKVSRAAAKVSRPRAKRARRVPKADAGTKAAGPEGSGKTGEHKGGKPSSG